MTIDPLAEKFAHQSSFVYADNDPIKNIDFMGMNADGYTIDEEGYINRVDDTGGGDYDVLYTKNDYEAEKASGQKNADGNSEPENQVKVDDTSILPSLEKVENISESKQFSESTSSASSIDALAVFKFASDNSNAEWSITKFTSGSDTKYSVSTFHNEDFSPGLGQLGISESSVLTRWHSHPGISPSNERSSMGETRDGSGGSSDLSKAIRRYNKNGRETYPMNVYFPTSRNFYHVSPFGVRKSGTAKK